MKAASSALQNEIEAVISFSNAVSRKINNLSVSSPENPRYCFGFAPLSQSTRLEMAFVSVLTKLRM